MEMEEGPEESEQPEEEPLGEDEREALQQDLLDVQVLKEVLGSKGIRGAVFYCPDCDEDHFLGWDLLAGNLQELLSAGESPVHEPAFDPDPNDYVSWDYARGFLDGYESVEDEELNVVTAKLTDTLKSRGWNDKEINVLLSGVGLEPFEQAEE